MHRLRDHALKGLEALDSLTEGPPVISQNANLDHQTETRINLMGQPRPAMAPTLLFNSYGAPAIATYWLSWTGISAWMIARGSSGAWLLLFCIGLLGLLRQASNHVCVTSHGVWLRDGVGGYRHRHVDREQINGVWSRQSTLGGLLGYGRVGLHLKSGEVIWSPFLSDPVRVKHAVLQAVTGRRTPWLPVEDQAPLTGV